MDNNTQLIAKDVDNKLELLMERVSAVENIRDIELPYYERQIKFMQRKNRDIIQMISGNREQEKEKSLIARAWKALRAGIDKRAEDGKKLKRMGQIFSKYHIHQSFKRYQL